MKTSLRLIPTFFVAVFFVSTPNVQASSCFASSTASMVQSDLESVLPSIDGLLLVSKEQRPLLIGFMPRSFLGISSVRKYRSLFGWKLTGAKGSPLREVNEYKNSNGLWLWSYSFSAVSDTSSMVWEVAGEEPGSTVPQKSHYHYAIIRSDGSFQVFEHSKVIVEWNNNYNISGFLVKECVNGKMAVTSTIPFTSTILVRERMYGYSDSGLPCEEQKLAVR